MTDAPPATLALSLVSHTNAGKTTLARTLLGRDIGEVRDAPHVTELAEAHALITSAEGDRLLLWDTPGLGDSQRLARRLALQGRPLGWLLSQVWDRWRDRPFWASQQAIRHVMDQTDVALYLVNAAEEPEDAAYLLPELQVLALLDKPVIVLLNQLGSPSVPEADAQQLQRWRDHLAGRAGVRAVLPLDAFARCWVQEAVLLQAVAQALPGGQQAAMARLQAAWVALQRQTWQAAMDALAGRLAGAALDQEPLPQAGWGAPLQALQGAVTSRLGRALGREGLADSEPQARAMAALAERLDARVRRSMDVLLGLHQVPGKSQAELLDQLARHFARHEPASEGRAALWGGLVTGALGGLKADLASGGLTLGGGLLLGGVLGALGAAGAVRGVNRIRGRDRAWLAWDTAVLDALLRSALLAYLAVAHHGRGRGVWQQDEPPPAWTDAVQAALDQRQAAWAALWRQRQARLEGGTTPVTGAPDPAGGAPGGGQAAGPAVTAAGAAPALPAPAFQAALRQQLAETCAAVLVRLYPDASARVGLGGWPAAPH